MAELFLSTKQNVSLHINNIFKEDELEEISVVKESLTTAKDGKKYKTKFYNLDVIISVGYRVKSKRGTKFRQWANRVLKDYIIRGYAINQQMKYLEQKMDTRFQEYDAQIADIQDKISIFIHSSFTPGEVECANVQMCKKKLKNPKIINLYIIYIIIYIIYRTSTCTFFQIWKNHFAHLHICTKIAVKM